MASITGAASTTFAHLSFNHNQVPLRLTSNQNSVSFFANGSCFPSPTIMRSKCLQICCAAKPETVKKVADIVKKQLALPDGSSVSGESKFAALGADSLDTVEIVMGLEEEFGISVEEERAQSIASIQDAADMIEDLIASKSG